MQGPIICGNCGNVSAEARKPKRGSTLLEILLWCCAILPGVVYSIWRRNGKLNCPFCGNERIMPLNSPGGQETQRRFNPPK